MKFSYNWLKELVPGLPGPEETAELLTRHALEVEEAAESGDDWYLDVDVLPNRMADASSHRGIARELAAILTMRNPNRKPVERTLPDETFTESDEKAKDFVSVNIEDTKGCAFYAARVVHGVAVGESPAWLKKRLRLLGLEPINNIVDVTNYVMLEYGQPLHAFDVAKIAGRAGDGPKQITVRRAKQAEKMKALDGETYTLPSDVTVIADQKRALAIGGIKGGSASGVTKKTNTIVLEAAQFDATAIYRSSRVLGIRTDASKRFEAGRTPAVTIQALDRAAQLLGQVAGGEIAKGVVRAGSASVRARAVLFDPKSAGRLLGVEVKKADARRALTALGCTMKAKGKNLVVTPPKTRTDLILEEDLIEEVGRLIGYEAAGEEPPRGLMTPAGLPDVYRWADKARDVLAREGLQEVMRYSFVSERLMELWGMAGYPMRQLENPQSADLTHLRISLLPNLLEMAEEERRARADIRIFEVGSIFVPLPGEKLRELPALGMVLAYESLAVPQGFVGEHAPFYEAKGVVEALLEGLGVTDAAFRPMEEPHGCYAAGRSADVFIGAQRLGSVGELDQSVVKRHKQLGNFAVAELNMRVLAEAASGEHAYRSPSRYPEVLRDVAVLVPLEVTADEVNQLMVTAGPDWLRDIDLFDYYEGDQVPEGMKSLAFRLAYQSEERTLTDQEVNAAQEKIEAALRKQSWEIR